ncbi:MAG: aspartate aminotransferase family protein [Polyangiaceae bacterium]
MLPDVRVPPPGPRSRALMQRLAERECPAFAARRARREELDGAAPIVIERGEGSNVWDADGNRYVDLAAGFGSILCGHGDPAIREAAVGAPTDLLQGLGDLYASPWKVELVERLAALVPGMSDARVLLCQSGADAITGALKTAALFTGKTSVVAFEGAYHGLGYAPLAAIGFKPSYREPFRGALNPDVLFLPYPASPSDGERALDALRSAVARTGAGAVLIEPILGRGGVVLPPPRFLHDVAEVARDAGAVSIADEIWTGLGRSGSLVRSADEGARFDVVCFGKGLGGGLSISAVVARDEVMQAWAREGEVVHTSTHAGSPIACRAALAVLDRIARDRLDIRARDEGARFAAALRARAAGRAAVRAVRGAGLMVGVEHADGATGLRVMRGLLERGFMTTTGGAGGEVAVFTPPLTIAPEELDACVDAMDAVWSERA